MSPEHMIVSSCFANIRYTWDFFREKSFDEFMTKEILFIIEKLEQLERKLLELREEKAKLAASWWKLPFYRLPLLVNKCIFTQLIYFCTISLSYDSIRKSFFDTSPEHSSSSTKDTSAASSPAKKNETENHEVPVTNATPIYESESECKMDLQLTLDNFHGLHRRKVTVVRQK